MKAMPRWVGSVTTTDLDAAADADLVVEAVFEKLEIKQEVFAALDKICRDDAVLATNTSAIPITKIAAVTSRPESVVGTHFFSPVPMMQLCELVRGHKTSDETLAAARSFAEGVGKTCIVVNRDVAGFVTTRLISALAMEAINLVRVGRRERRGHRCRLQAGLRARDGTARDDRPHRRRHHAQCRAATSTTSAPTQSSTHRSCCRGWSMPGELGRKIRAWVLRLLLTMSR